MKVRGEAYTKRRQILTESSATNGLIAPDTREVFLALRQNNVPCSNSWPIALLRQRRARPPVQRSLAGLHDLCYRARLRSGIGAVLDLTERRGVCVSRSRATRVHGRLALAGGFGKHCPIFGLTFEENNDY